MARLALTASIAVVLASCGDAGEPDANTTTDASSTSVTATSASVSASVTTSAETTTQTSASSATTIADDGSTDDGSTDATSDDTTATTGGEVCVDDHRVIAYLANWAECPTATQLAQYSHVMIAFAVSYTWTPEGVICDESCTISPVDGCLGTPLPELVTQLHAAGIEVLLSFGGASMGGLWEGTCGEMVRCWDHCLDQVDALAARLTEIVDENDLDGVDIDYEYCLSDPSYTGFVEGLTTELRASLDATFPGDHKLLTHAPMDSELEVGDPYFDIVANVAADLDFLMPQYYNGGRSPFVADQLAEIRDHHAALVNGPFGGDASKVLFGWCIEPGCQPVATQPEALEIAETFERTYPSFGGVFFWAHPDDTDGWFSGPFRDHYDATICTE
jgi:chitinase